MLHFESTLVSLYLFIYFVVEVWGVDYMKKIPAFKEALCSEASHICPITARLVAAVRAEAGGAVCYHLSSISPIQMPDMCGCSGLK